MKHQHTLWTDPDTGKHYCKSCLEPFSIVENDLGEISNDVKNRTDNFNENDINAFMQALGM